MAKWQRVMCMVAVLAGGATMIANSILGIRRGNEMIAFGDRWEAIQERRRQIEMPNISEGSRLQAALAHQDIDREEKQLYADRSFTNEGYVIKQHFVIVAAAACLFAVGLTLGVTWRRTNQQP